MINKLKTPKGIRFDILQNGHSRHRMGAITGLTEKELRAIMVEIEDELFQLEIKHVTVKGVHPHYGRIE